MPVYASVCPGFMTIILCRADSWFAPSQWEMALRYNGVSHWLGASLESALWCISLEIYLRLMIWDTVNTDNKSTLVQVMACLSQYWPRYMSSLGHNQLRKLTLAFAETSLQKTSWDHRTLMCEQLSWICENRPRYKICRILALWHLKKIIDGMPRNTFWWKKTIYLQDVRLQLFALLILL